MNSPPMPLFRVEPSVESFDARCWNDRDWAGFSHVVETLGLLTGSGMGAQSPSSQPSFLQRARAQYAGRRARDRVFADHPELFADPAWDILLDLYIAHLERRRVSVSSACIAGCVAQTTALRRLADLERRGLVERSDDEADQRRRFVTLTSKAASLVQSALSHV